VTWAGCGWAWVSGGLATAGGGGDGLADGLRPGGSWWQGVVDGWHRVGDGTIKVPGDGTAGARRGVVTCRGVG